MNVERLHAIAIATRADLQSTAVVRTMQQLRDALRGQVNAPQEPGHQQQVAGFLQQLSAALADAPSNNFPPTWRQVVEELGMARLLGEELITTVTEVFERNQITPSVAADEIDSLTADLEALNANLDQLVSTLAHFGIGSETLEEGEAEVGVLIPRPAVDNELAGLGSELVELKKLFGPFSEIATGSRPPLHVRSISSSDFGVFLDVGPKVAALVAVAVERVVALYKSLLEIRRLRQELADQGVSDQNLAGVDEQANTQMATGIDIVVDELLPSTSTDVEDGRRNELRIELRNSLNAIANRIDRGYNIDVRAGQGEEEEADESEEGDETEEGKAIRVIQNASPNLRFINRTGRPILSLPETTAPEEED
jgi:hypothetical protein